MEGMNIREFRTQSRVETYTEVCSSSVITSVGGMFESFLARYFETRFTDRLNIGNRCPMESQHRIGVFETTFAFQFFARITLKDNKQ